MLVGYSSSSDEENDAIEGEADAAADHNKTFYRRCQQNGGENHCPLKKKPKIEESSTTARLPLPDCLLDMFPEDLEAQTEDSSLHDGRIRSFKHERGNWATYVYFPYKPEEEFEELMEALLSTAAAFGVVLIPQEEFHLSLSQTVVLKHHWIQPFIQGLKAGLVPCKRFVCSASRLKVYCNAEKTRTFLGVEVVTGHAQLLNMVHVVDRTLTDFHLDTFYQDPSFHVSLAWCVGDFTVQLQQCLHKLQNLVDNHEGETYHLWLDCSELRCRTGNKTFRFPLAS
ncbi:U6 snRNA phosphodiesterase 1 [Corythoichthys intestinalis]|uniref:U6 snRNA phosphodiesterase 1 n=1 Tax=Corythoichthys intestinalis TaxID=161448 RepID=UPI0025A55247|nr:U6 snRNA phosphodiesterase 1 [Corythoichthys intestinalis]XP_061813354.1 U6 snRNA phosphodiesterase 1-like [Nerophis lumbriciformis]